MMMDELKEKYKIAILDDEPYWCDAIVGLLGREPSLCVVGTASTQAQAAALAGKYCPDVFLVDMMLGHAWQTGVSATIEISNISPETKVIILTSSEDEDEVIDAVAAGAADYLTKSKCEDLLPVIMRHLWGGFSPGMILAREMAELRREMLMSTLTAQEREIIMLLSQNVPRSSLADIMHKSESTIKTQISGILKKFDVENMDDAIDKIEHGGVFIPKQKKHGRSKRR